MTDLPASEDIDLPATDALADPVTMMADTSSQIITVHTDVLEIKIDLEGGDVVGAALKNYPKTLDDPSDPFVLLERNAQRTYVAQSGLVGTDGIDQGRRAQYRSAQNVYRLEGVLPQEVTIEYIGGDSPLQRQ